jgi:hypothetical protein
MTLRANERAQIQKKPEQKTGDGENLGDAVDQQNREDDHGEEESPFRGFLPKGLLPVGGVTFGRQTRANDGSGASPGADCSSSADEQGCDCEQRTFEKVRVRGVLDEGPDDVVGGQQIGEKARETGRRWRSVWWRTSKSVADMNGYTWIDP